MGEPEIIAAINHAWAEIQGFPHGVDEMPEDLGWLRAQSHTIASKVGNLVDLIDEFDPSAKG